MECGPAFVATPPQQFRSEFARWAQRACRRSVCRTAALYGLRDAFGTAADVARCFRKRLAARGLDVSALPADASWVRALSLAEFEAEEGRGAAPQPGLGDPQSQRGTTAPQPPELPRPADAQAQQDVAALQSPEQRAPRDDAAGRCEPDPAAQPSAMVWQPSPLSPNFAEDGRRRLQELRDLKASTRASRV
jgi:hypothetical protein